MLLLLFRGDAAVVAAPPAATYGWAFDAPRKKRKREAWQDELAKLKPELPVAVEPVTEVEEAPVQKTDPGARDYIESLFASIEQAKKQQKRAQLAAKVAKAEREREAAELMLTQAIEAERQARQEMEELDVAFVAALLAHL